MFIVSESDMSGSEAITQMLVFFKIKSKSTETTLYN